MSDRREGIGDAGYDAWIQAAAEGAPYYLECPVGHGSLPPRTVCPTCGARDLAERALATPGTVETVTVTHVATPAFAEDAPYAVAIADFGPVRLTGQVVGVDPESVEPGLEVDPSVGPSKTTGEPVLTFEPV